MLTSANERVSLQRTTNGFNLRKLKTKTDIAKYQKVENPMTTERCCCLFFKNQTSLEQSHVRMPVISWNIDVKRKILKIMTDP